jgi:hypothetical protein
MLLYCFSRTGPDRYIPLFGQFQYNPAAAEDHPGGPQAAPFLEQVPHAFFGQHLGITLPSLVCVRVVGLALLLLPLLQSAA